MGVFGVGLVFYEWEVLRPILLVVTPERPEGFGLVFLELDGQEQLLVGVEVDLFCAASRPYLGWAHDVGADFWSWTKRCCLCFPCLHSTFDRSRVRS